MDTNTSEKILKTMKIAIGIQNQAKEKKLSIQRIKVGKSILKQLGQNTLGNLSIFINDKNLRKRYDKLNRKLNSIKRKKERKRKLLLKKQKNILNKAFRKLNSSVPGTTPEEPSFKFAPGFAGMPFPPFLMNGPHFHPPMHVNINTLPFPNPRASTPYKVAQTNVREMSKIKSIDLSWNKS